MRLNDRHNAAARPRPITGAIAEESSTQRYILQ